MPNETVLAFVDYENIRISLQMNFVEAVSLPWFKPSVMWLGQLASCGEFGSMAIGPEGALRLGSSKTAGVR